MVDWIVSNREWVFSGVGVALLGAVVAWFRRDPRKSPQESLQNHNINSNSISIVNNVGAPGSATRAPGGSGVTTEEHVRRIKDSTRILFIDDDDKFKVVKILKNSGWTNTSVIKDVASLDDRHVLEADVFFVDIQGVGLKLGFKDEGLGLAAALKDRYPEKKVVIYSAEPRGERFHKALRKADASLEKNADPYEFQRLVDDFAGIS